MWLGLVRFGKEVIKMETMRSIKNIVRVEFELESVCPLLMDKWNDESTAKTDEEYKKEAEKKIYRDEKGNPCIESRAIKALMRMASSELGKKMEGKKNRQMISAGIFMEPTNLVVGKKKPDLIRKDIVSRNASGKITRVPTYRPQFNDWKVKGLMNLIGVAQDFAIQSLELGGLKYGLYGFRPEFGRFKVISWKVIK